MISTDSWYIWTDFGGVLTPPIADSFSVFCIKLGLDRTELSQAMRQVAQDHCVADPLELLDRPILSEAEWISEINRYLTRKMSLTTLADDWFDQRVPNESWVDVLRDLRTPTVRVGMLSNMVPAWDRHWRKMVAPDELFEHVVLSFEVGFRKPEPEMFNVAASCAGVSADRCILVDDLESNCDGARREGWKAIHFQDAAAAKSELLQILGG